MAKLFLLEVRYKKNLMGFSKKLKNIHMIYANKKMDVTSLKHKFTNKLIISKWTLTIFAH